MAMARILLGNKKYFMVKFAQKAVLKNLVKAKGLEILKFQVFLLQTVQKKQ